MEVAPRTLREVEFREKLRGYNQDDVDEFLERVAAGIEVLQERLRQANERAMRSEQKLSEIPEDDDTLRRTLVLAQRTADMTVREAQDKASDILANAQSEARALITEAEDAARRITNDAEREVRAELSRLEEARAQLQIDVENLQHHLETERSRLHLALTNALRWVDDNLPSVEPAPEVRQVDIPPPSAPSAGHLPAGSSKPQAADAGRLPSDPAYAHPAARPADSGGPSTVVFDADEIEAASPADRADQHTNYRA
jgi:DivIVA domain-containing protein